MNKAVIIVCALVAVSVAVVAASKGHNHRLRQFDDVDEFQPEHGHLEHRPHHLRHSGLEHERERELERERERERERDEADWEAERQLGGLRHGAGEHLCSHGDCPHHERPIHKSAHLKNGLRHAHSGRRAAGRRPVHAAAAGVGAVGAAGAIGGLRDHERHGAGFETGTRLSDRKGIEGHRGFLANEDKAIRGGHLNHAANEDEGIHKHQVLNRDKTIIKDRTTGVNDVDGFRHSSEKSNGAGFEAGEHRLLGAGAGASAHSDRELDHRLSGGIDGERDLEAGGAIGGVGGVGGGVGGGSF